MTDRDGRLPVQKAHVGVIVPAVNRVCEQQFHAYAPATLGVHTMRARIAGKWSRPIEELADEIRHVTEYAAECRPDLLERIPLRLHRNLRRQSNWRTLGV